MQLEIWSDILCPFCYIGKRKLEAALAEFPQADQVQITWKSFQLDPDFQSAGGENYLESLSARKGWSLDQTRQITANVRNMALGVNLHYNFEDMIQANSLDAHRLTHLAAKHGLQQQAEEALFRAHFVEGKDVGNHAVLAEIGAAIGLEPTAVSSMLDSKEFADAVQHDVAEARQLGINAVPFFVFNRKYGVSGAQDKQVFLQTLEKALEG
jgi:predicted DsbA family dithiol-disulfide isomerase